MSDGIDTATLWTVILLLGLGSYLLRFSFMGLVGDRPLPDWLRRHLRYTAVAVLPALCAPLVVFPQAPGASVPAFVGAALATLLAGALTRNVFAGLGAGVAALTLLMALVG